jgi:hypothetical protein
MHEIFKEANIIVLPKSLENEVNSGNPLSPNSLAIVFALYKQMLGSNNAEIPSAPE